MKSKCVDDFMRLYYSSNNDTTYLLSRDFEMYIHVYMFIIAIAKLFCVVCSIS